MLIYVRPTLSGWAAIKGYKLRLRDLYLLIADRRKENKRVQGLLNFYKQINTYLQINVNVIKSKVTGDKRGYTVAFDRKD